MLDYPLASFAIGNYLYIDRSMGDSVYLSGLFGYLLAPVRR